jgi:hypothetical protein
MLGTTEMMRTLPCESESETSLISFATSLKSGVGAPIAGNSPLNSLGLPRIVTEAMYVSCDDVSSGRSLSQGA